MGSCKRSSQACDWAATYLKYSHGLPLISDHESVKFLLLQFEDPVIKVHIISQIDVWTSHRSAFCTRGRILRHTIYEVDIKDRILLRESILVAEIHEVAAFGTFPLKQASSDLTQLLLVESRAGVERVDPVVVQEPIVGGVLASVLEEVMKIVVALVGFSKA